MRHPDNSTSARIPVAYVKGTQLARVLYCGDPPPEVAVLYLRSSLRKHHGVQYLDPLDPGVERFPNDESQLKAYNVVVLSDRGKGQISRAGSKAVKGFVLDISGLLMIGGFASFVGHNLRGNYHNSEVEEVLPVVCSSTPDDVAVYRGFHPKPFNRFHPIMKGIPWNDFPVLVGYNKVTPKEDATLLLEYNSDPILVVREVGKGRSAAFTSDCAPHWCGGLIDWPYYDEFWSRIVHWLAKDLQPQLISGLFCITLKGQHEQTSINFRESRLDGTTASSYTLTLMKGS